jgi:DNA-binding response OmpR family regulator
MSITQLKAHGGTHTASQPVAAPPERAAVWQCLVLSADARRREMLSDAATESGWTTICCRDADAAQAAAYRRLVQLALIDLCGAGAGPPPRMRQLVERLTAKRDLLVALCGRDADAIEEVWARQLGAWLYLPKVTDASDVASICGEALHLTASASRHARGGTGPARQPSQRGHDN